MKTLIYRTARYEVWYSGPRIEIWDRKNVVNGPLRIPYATLVRIMQKTEQLCHEMPR